MKRRMLCLLLLCLTALNASVFAEAPELHYIDHPDGVHLIDLLPTEDGGLLLCGHSYTKGAIQQGYVYDDDRTSLRTDAYAVALDASGREKWRLRIGDPEAVNFFTAVAPMQDGDFLLTFRSAMGTWGTHHYIVGPDGAVEGMLPSRALREQGLLYTLRPLDGGFLGGGYETEDGIGYRPMLDAPLLLFIDRSMAEVWRLEDSSLRNCLFEAASAGEDGYALSGMYYSAFDNGYGVAGSVLLRLDPNGRILWQKMLSHSDQSAWISNVLLIPNGELLVCGRGDPTDVDAVLPGATLSKFDREGNLLWTKGYDADYGLSMLVDILPFGDGFAVTEGSAGSGVYYVDTNGEVLGRYRPPVVDNAYLTIFSAQDGGLYALGNIATPTDEITDGVPVNRSFYVKLSVSDFAPVEW